MSLKQSLRSFAHILQDQGIRATFRGMGDRLYIRWLEWRFDIRSEAVIDLKEFGIQNELYRPYVPTDYRSFRKIINALQIRASEEVFLDFGSGLGRAVVIAATRPFRKIYGVEIAAQLAEVARQNVRRALPRLKCRDIQIITTNAREFAIPDEVTVIYFFNPFCGEVLADVLKNIRESLRRHPRVLRLICKIPAQSAFEEEIHKHTWLAKERELIFDVNSRYLLLSARA